MPALSRGRSILLGITLGVVFGTVVGLIGAVFDWPVAVRGGITGALLAIGFAVFRRYGASDSTQA